MSVLSWIVLKNSLNVGKPWLFLARLYESTGRAIALPPVAKATHIFSAKNIVMLCIESAKTVKEMTLNELVKLTTL